MHRMTTPRAVILVMSLFGVFAVCSNSPASGREPPPKVGVVPTNPSPVTPGELVAELPSFHCLSFRWYVEGDTNQNATAAVHYRKAGTEEWKEAQPLYRCHFFEKQVEGKMRRYQRKLLSNPVPTLRIRDGKLPNLLAGSIFNLRPGTEYEVKLHLKDPDGGEAERIVKAKTRTMPKVPPRANVVNITPDLDRRALGKKLSGLKPGDRVIFAPGTYGRLSFSARGTAEKPIVLEGAEVDKCIIDGGKAEAIMLSKSAHLWFRNLTVKTKKHGFRGQGDFITVTHCKIFGDYRGVSLAGDGHIITDNLVKGPCKWPRSKGITSQHGIDTAGWGHIIAHNRVSGYADGISLANYAISGNIEMYGNEISECTDDGIEADFIWHNGRIYRNRLTNCFMGVSLAPIFGGPVYFMHNELYNVRPYKICRQPSGLYIFHNSSFSPRQGMSSPSHDRWRCVVFRNNLIIGSERYAVEATPGYHRIDIDYCGWRKTEPGADGRFFKWNQRRYATLAAMQKAGLQPHSIQLDLDVWKRAANPVFEKQYIPGSAEAADFTLSENSRAIDRGQPLPNINDGFAGRAPDLGSRELRAPAPAPAPAYGPRPEMSKATVAERAEEAESIWRKLGRKTALSAASLDAHADTMVRARKMAVEGRFDEAARLVEEEASRVASEEAKGALLCAARGFRATRGLRKLIIESGGGRRVFVSFLGRPMRGKVLRADERGFAAEVFGNEVEVGWETLSPGRFLALARRAAGKDASDPVRALLDDFAFAHGTCPRK